MARQPDATSTSPIGLQLWTVRDALAADADQALARVKAAGFAAVELAPLPPGLDPARLAALLAGHGLSVLSIHTDLPTPETVPGLVQLSHECRCPKVVWHGWPKDPRFGSADGVRELAVACNAAAALATEHGLSLGVHNHWWEFEPLGGDRPIWMLLDALHPDVFWQLDVYWAQTAGADPAAAAAELGPRLRSVHWKDGPCAHGRPMTALGRGEVDVPRILGALPGSVDWVVELDECATDPLEAARQSRVYLESHRG